MIITLLFIYNSILEQNMTLYECLRRCTGMGNESRVTCMKNYAWWPCHKYNVNYMIMQGNMTMMKCVIINRTEESCMAIYLGIAMEIGRYGGCFEEDIKRFMCDRAYRITGFGCTGEVCTNSLMSTTQPSSCRHCWASKCRGL